MVTEMGENVKSGTMNDTNESKVKGVAFAPPTDTVTKLTTGAEPCAAWSAGQASASQMLTMAKVSPGTSAVPVQAGCPYTTRHFAWSFAAVSVGSRVDRKRAASRAALA